LFDEVEKADKNILNLFLQILDEGQITDAFGEKCVFSNTIIILTSNAGSEFIRQAVMANTDYTNIQKELMNYVQEQGFYTPEFLNRFTAVTVFRPLSLPEIEEVAKLLIGKLVATLQKERGVSVQVAPEAVKKLAELGYDPKMGARPRQRSIQEHLENVLAKKLLSGEIKRGDQILVNIGDLEV
jgi:ATP-dependent Clp protease ATP-binding subunit ClpA